MKNKPAWRKLLLESSSFLGLINYSPLIKQAAKHGSESEATSSPYFNEGIYLHPTCKITNLLWIVFQYFQTIDSRTNLLDRMLRPGIN